MSLEISSVADQQWKDTTNNQLVLGCVTEIALRAMDRLSGNEVASTVDGEYAVIGARAERVVAQVRVCLQAKIGGEQ